MLPNYIPVLHTTNMQLYSVFFSSSFHTIKFLRRVQHFLLSTESQAQLPSFDVVVRPKEIATHHSKRKPQGDEQQKVDKARKLTKKHAICAAHPEKPIGSAAVSANNGNTVAVLG